MPAEENAVNSKACKKLCLLKAQQWFYFCGRYAGRLRSAWLSTVVGVCFWGWSTSRLEERTLAFYYFLVFLFAASHVVNYLCIDLSPGKVFEKRKKEKKC